MRKMGDENTSFPPLTEDEKNELVNKFKKAVHYYGYKYRFLDNDIEEIKGWGFLGLSKAINHYDSNRNVPIEKIVFRFIKQEVFRVYFVKPQPKSSESIDKEIYSDGDTTLGQTLEAEKFFLYREIKIAAEEALFEQSDIFKKVTMDYFFSPKSLDELSTEYEVPREKLKKMYRRGQALIKQHLINNDIIVSYLTNPNEEKKQNEKVINQKPIPPADYGKLRYLRRYFTELTIGDLAILLNTSTFMVKQLLDYPTTTYTTSKLNDSIKNKANQYFKKKYPEKVPSEVIVIQKPYKNNELNNCS